MSCSARFRQFSDMAVRLTPFYNRLRLCTWVGLLTWRPPPPGAASEMFIIAFPRVADPAFHFNADPHPDHAPHQSDRDLRPLLTHQSSILSLQKASIVSVHCPLRLYYEPLKLLNFDFNADSDPDPDPAFHPNEQRCTILSYYTDAPSELSCRYPSELGSTH